MSLRQLARQVGVGRFLVKLRQIQAMGVSTWLATHQAKKKFLPLINELPPIPCGTEAEAHMLLHHGRIFDGTWSMYSLAHFSDIHYRFVVHDDGSLTDADHGLLRKVLPGIRIVTRKESDATAQRFFQGHGLKRCEKLRETLVFGLKLFDPFWYLESDRFTLLDSDTLFLGRPSEVINSQGSGPPRYQFDVQSNYVLDPQKMATVLKTPCIENFNPGVVIATRSTMHFELVEEWLENAEFWSERGEGKYFSELTVWAMLLSLAKAQPFSSKYQICPKDPTSPDLTFGHFCGGGACNTYFYRRAVPYVYEKIKHSAVLSNQSRQAAL